MSNGSAGNTSIHSSSSNNSICSTSNSLVVVFRIPLADIRLVETDHCPNLKNHHHHHHHHHSNHRKKQHHRTILTLSNEIQFEFDCSTRNSHDILLAFLQTSVDAARILDRNRRARARAAHEDQSNTQLSRDEQQQQDNKQVISISTSLSFDQTVASTTMNAEGHLDKHLHDHIERETWPEKISRSVAHSLHEISQSLCTSCCQEDRMPDTTLRDELHDDRRSSPNTTMHHDDDDDYNELLFANLEMDEDESSYSRYSCGEGVRSGCAS